MPNPVTLLLFLAFSLTTYGVGMATPSTSDTLASAADSLYLNVVTPSADTVRVTANRQRIGANTTPGSRAWIDGTEVKVHPNGVFVGLIYPDYGLNEYTISVVSEDGDSLSQNLLFDRSRPDSTLPRDPLVIDSQRMQPAGDLWLDVGDILEVRFRGSPGYDASFSLDGVIRRKSMRELQAEETGGIEGIYEGRYKVRPGDRVVDEPIEFRLRRSFWTRERTQSSARITITPDEFPRVAKTTGNRVFLNAGMGTDRLGGARLGYIDEGIPLQITGKRSGAYRVRLSESMIGWLPVRFGELLPRETHSPSALVGSIATAHLSGGDRVTVNLDQRVPYVSKQLDNPARLQVDLFGTSSNTNWITHHLAAEGVDHVHWEQIESNRYRLTIQLAYDHHWGYRISYNDSDNLVVHINRPPVIDSEEPLNGLRVALDAGHGGGNRGTQGASGILEKDVNLEITRKVQELLEERGVDVVMTRTGDESVLMQERMDIVESSGAHLFVSIHANSIGGASDPDAVYGTSTYYRDIGSKPLADTLYDHLLDLDLGEFGVIGSFNFSLNAVTAMPNVLVETGFMSNPEDEIKLTNTEFQVSIAEQIVEGLEHYMNTYGDL